MLQGEVFEFVPGAILCLGVRLKHLLILFEFSFSLIFIHIDECSIAVLFVGDQVLKNRHSHVCESRKDW